MKRCFVIFCAAAALLAAGCNREELAPESTAPALGGKTVITLTTDVTKTTMGEVSEGKRPVYWANGDKVAVNGVVSEALSGLEEGSASASFTFASVIEPPFNAVYPETIWKDNLSVTLPQQAQSGILPLVGYGDAESLTVKPLTAAVKLSVKKYSGENPDLDKIVSVSITSEDTQLSGVFGIEFETGALTPYLNPVEEDRTVSIRPNLTLTETAKDLFIPVPAGTYNFKVRLTDIQGHFMEISTTSAKTFTAGEIKAFPEIEFLPTGTAIDVVITSAEDLIQFAQDWNSEKWVSVVAQVANDITFDAESSAAFNATGGIGLKESYGDAKDYYFNGTFDGNGKTISGLKATVPLFKATGSDGIVQNFTIADDCEFVFTHPNTADANFGAVVDYHKGLLEGVTVKADVSLAPVEDVAHLTSIGGLVGRATVGSLKNCSYDGNLAVDPGFSTKNNKLIVGGLVGSLSNTGSISDSFLNGTILVEATVAVDADDKGTNPYTIVGGILGQNSGGGSIIDCETTDHPTVNGYYGADGTTPLPGTIVVNSATSYHTATGGFVGEAIKGTISGCKNAATISITMMSTSNDNARYIRTGGIAGYNRSEATISDCVNNAKVTHRANPRLHALGGIVGLNGGTVSGCTNNTNLAVSTTSKKPYSGRVVNIGGVLGENRSENVSDLHNSAQVLISRIEDTKLMSIRMGGVIGYNTATIDGGVQKFTNSGQVYFNTSCSSWAEDLTLGYFLGGIAGCSEGGIRNAVNEGIVQTPKWSSGTPANIFMGGIIGRGIDAPLSDCTNKGNVFTSTSPTAGSAFTAFKMPIRMGGVAGELSGASSVARCRNQALIYLNASNNKTEPIDSAFFEGGIVGLVQGTESVRIPVSECTWEYTAANVGARRGTCGGVVGYAEYADISDCEVTVNYSKYNYYTGGIAGWIVNSTLTGCKFHGTSVVATEGFGMAGVVAKLTAGSTVDGCYSYATTISGKEANDPALGGIAAISEEGTTIKNCHYTTAFPICPDTNFTDGGGNAADL